MKRFSFSDQELAQILLAHLTKEKKLKCDVPYKGKIWVVKHGESIVLTIEFKQ